MVSTTREIRATAKWRIANNSILEQFNLYVAGHNGREGEWWKEAVDTRNNPALVSKSWKTDAADLMKGE
jgi:hypothetical protein